MRAVTDHDRTRPTRSPERFGGRGVDSLADLLADPDVDVVVVATPPAGHASVAGAALAARGTCSARNRSPPTPPTWPALVQAAADARPGSSSSTTCSATTRCWRACLALQQELLGAPQRFLFENDASDEDLGDDHWFWDQRHSGGIFVEHGVHFFDAAAMLLGRAGHVGAGQLRAPGGDRAGRPGQRDGPPRGGRARHPHAQLHARAPVRTSADAARLRRGRGPHRGLDPGRRRGRPLDRRRRCAAVRVAAVARRRAARRGRVPPRPLRPGSRSTYAATPRPAPPAAGAPTLHIPHHVRIGITLGGPSAKAEVYAESVRAAMADLAHSVATGTTPPQRHRGGSSRHDGRARRDPRGSTQQSVNLSGDLS